MKSEMFTGIEFEYTLDGVLLEKYDIFFSEKYSVNSRYLVDHAEELIQLRDVVIPHKLIPLPKLNELISERTANDFNAKKYGIIPMSGIYEWEYRFSRDFPRTIDEMREDDIRLALDIVKKYPEHKDLIISEEAQL